LIIVSVIFSHGEKKLEEEKRQGRNSDQIFMVKK